MQNKYFWATVSIVIMWLAVLFVGVYGPTMDAGGINGAQDIPVALSVVALCALVGTIIVGVVGFRSS